MIERSRMKSRFCSSRTCLVLHFLYLQSLRDEDICKDAPADDGIAAPFFLDWLHIGDIFAYWI